jgi:spore coat polysaccharide biosynthesis protein SpsF
MLERVLEAIEQSKLIDEVVVASPEELPILNTNFIGDENDVLKRYYDCATEFSADVIVRITSDCPLVDPFIIDMAIEYQIDTRFPYVIFAPVDGLDVEVFTYEMLKDAHEKATSKEDREHVTPYMRRRTKVSVDTKEDLERVRQIWNGSLKLSSL